MPLTIFQIDIIILIFINGNFVIRKNINNF